jgi:predicted amidohydrolase
VHLEAPSPERRIRAAAVQLDSVVGDVAANMAKVEALVKTAAATGARLIAIPEFFTTQLPNDARAHGAVLKTDNVALDMLKRLARRHSCWMGGSMLVAEGEGIFNRYHFVEPDGRVHVHDKDLPTMWENAFYQAGSDDGAWQTGLGGVGAGVCWWTLPFNWGPITRVLASVGALNQRLSENAPSEFARRVGVPVLQASHCGRFRTEFMLVPGLTRGLSYETEFVGCTQIVDGHGNVLAKRRTQEGPGVVSAEIELGPVQPARAIDSGFWMPSLPWTMRLYWHQQNVWGRSYYRAKGRRLGLLNAGSGT